MIVVLKADGRVALEHAQDFNRFHCEIDPAFASLEAARKAMAGIAEIESRDIAWIDRNALWALGAACGPGWLAPARAMVEKAARHGWVREREPAIKTHIVWRA